MSWQIPTCMHVLSPLGKNTYNLPPHPATSYAVLLIRFSLQCLGSHPKASITSKDFFLCFKDHVGFLFREYTLGGVSITYKVVQRQNNTTLSTRVTVPQLHASLISYQHQEGTGSGKQKTSLRKSLDRRHLSYSSLFFCLMAPGDGATPLKTTSFWCLQMYQKKRMIAVHMSRRWLAVHDLVAHHANSSESTSGIQSCFPSTARSKTTLLVQPRNPIRGVGWTRGAWSHRSQAPGWGRPRRWNLSAVQQRFLEDNHVKTYICMVLSTSISGSGLALASSQQRKHCTLIWTRTRHSSSTSRRGHPLGQGSAGHWQGYARGRRTPLGQHRPSLDQNPSATLQWAPLWLVANAPHG